MIGDESERETKHMNAGVSTQNVGHACMPTFWEFPHSIADRDESFYSFGSTVLIGYCGSFGIYTLNVKCVTYQ